MLLRRFPPLPPSRPKFSALFRWFCCFRADAATTRARSGVVRRPGMDGCSVSRSHRRKTGGMHRDGRWRAAWPLQQRGREETGSTQPPNPAPASSSAALRDDNVPPSSRPPSRPLYPSLPVILLSFSFRCVEFKFKLPSIVPTAECSLSRQGELTHPTIEQRFKTTK